MKQKLFFFICFCCFTAFSQQTDVFIDFGNSSSVTPGNWNNVVVSTQNQSGVTLSLIDSNGTSTGITFTLTDSFDHINNNGTPTPNSALPFVSTATQDSFFGETNDTFNSNVNATGGFTLSGLDASKYYSFSVFSSRTGAITDNRETLYTVVGSTTDSQALNPVNNTTNTADILNIQPDANGEIVLTAEPGPNNNNTYGFYYLNALQLVVSDSPITSMTPSSQLALDYPNGGHLWEVGKTVRIKWESIAIVDLLVEFSSDNGTTWTTIATVPASTQYYDMVVPNEISTSCLIRVSGDGLTDTSDAVFETIPNDGVEYRIVILGSSTAAGAGPSNINDAWVWKYTKYLTEMDTRYEVVNLALGGFATYNILPTGTPIPAGVTRTVDVARNITYAMSLDPDGVIINLPSNDAASGYPVADQLYNYSLISNQTTTANVPLWVATPQPRNFGSNTTNLTIQQNMITETYNTFGSMTVDFWTGLGVSGDNGILPQYDSGDGVHMNAAGHQILYDRIIGKGIHTTVKNNVDAQLSSVSFGKSPFEIYPNPTSDYVYINIENQFDDEVSISIFNTIGKEVYKTKTRSDSSNIKLNISDLTSGVYIIKMSTTSKSVSKKLIINQ